jgi:predicted nucleic acid-binding protein
MIVVLDASAAVEIVLKRRQAGKLSEYVGQADWVTAPELFIAEVTNTLWKYRQFAGLTHAACEKALEQAIALPDDFVHGLDLYREAFKLCCALDHPVYDILYLLTARRNSGLLLTLDKKLIQAAAQCSVETCAMSK